VHIEFLVEEPSVEIVLNSLVPRIAPGVTTRIHAFQGKQDLLRKLPRRLKGYRRWLPEDWRIVVLVDRDQQECEVLKAQLENAALEINFVTKSTAKKGQPFRVLNRLAIEELEAWFWGDLEAVIAAYPKVSLDLQNKKPYRDPDAILGGTWEALERELKQKGYYPDGLDKWDLAQRIAPHMEPGRNRSRSFQVFHDGLLEMIGG
jgi:hypothetical protein